MIGDTPGICNLYRIHFYMPCKVDESPENLYRDYIDGRSIMSVITIDWGIQKIEIIKGGHKKNPPKNVHKNIIF